MFFPYLYKLTQRNIVLASNSPRRQKILSELGLPFISMPANIDENIDLSCFPSAAEYTIELAKQKALFAAKEIQIMGRLGAQHLIIGADTVVVLDGKIIGKPKHSSDAFDILCRLSGKSHIVVTGVALLVFGPPNGADPFNSCEIRTFHGVTEVKMAQLNSDIISSYIATGDTEDKAGAYAIQGYGSTLIEHINGDYYNVVGFPVHKFSEELYRLFQANVM